VTGLAIFLAVFAVICILGKGLVKSIIYIGARAAI
jgi:hypothetical protein